jgi:hypothetical protein
MSYTDRPHRLQAGLKRPHVCLLGERIEFNRVNSATRFPTKPDSVFDNTVTAITKVFFAASACSVGVRAIAGNIFWLGVRANAHGWRRDRDNCRRCFCACAKMHFFNISTGYNCCFCWVKTINTVHANELVVFNTTITCQVFFIAHHTHKVKVIFVSHAGTHNNKAFHFGTFNLKLFQFL